MFGLLRFQPVAKYLNIILHSLLKKFSLGDYKLIRVFVEFRISLSSILNNIDFVFAISEYELFLFV